MDKQTLITILIFVFVGKQLWNIVWDVAKAILYLAIFLYGLDYLDPSTSKMIRTKIDMILNLNTSSIKSFMSDSSKTIMTILNSIGINNIIKLNKKTVKDDDNSQ